MAESESMSVFLWCFQASLSGSGGVDGVCDCGLMIHTPWNSVFSSVKWADWIVFTYFSFCVPDSFLFHYLPPVLQSYQTSHPLVLYQKLVQALGLAVKQVPSHISNGCIFINEESIQLSISERYKIMVAKIRQTLTAVAEKIQRWTKDTKELHGAQTGGTSLMYIPIFISCLIPLIEDSEENH